MYVVKITILYREAYRSIVCFVAISHNYSSKTILDAKAIGTPLLYIQHKI